MTGQTTAFHNLTFVLMSTLAELIIITNLVIAVILIFPIKLVLQELLLLITYSFQLQLTKLSFILVIIRLHGKSSANTYQC